MPARPFPNWASRRVSLDYPHRPVMVREVIASLMTAPDGVYVDGTVGSGGHSEAIGRRIGEGGRLICLDKDPEILSVAETRLSFLGEGVRFFKASYGDLDEILGVSGVKKVQGILLDLGVSSHQLDHSGRGFSFARDEPLDMRMDPDQEVTASGLVNTLPPKDLEDLLRRYGEEKRARAIARAIDRRRRKGRIGSSLDLADLVRFVVRRPRRPGAKDPATRTFQALRIAVNRELEILRVFLEKAPDLLEKGGRLVVLSYHSLEDRMVKQTMRDWERGCQCPPGLPVCACGKVPLFRGIHRKGLRPGQEEVEKNPRARSAVLRAAERI
ncbi:MAG: 16S rRNA (cytosine(1402)-N(4))-methyltransferase RsmH [Deltaproteobacteria bacterium]|nr:16S rRNA (cytosine(1402)-N(4))-methyltransferase RsmH [Deltaproteobacteria bacterium]